MQLRIRGFRGLGSAPAAIGAIALCWLSTAPRCSRGEERQLSPKSVVARFCDLDLDGVRLDGASPRWKQFRQLMVPRADWPEEPIGITKAYRIIRVQQSGEHAVVTVRYELLGRLQGDLESDGVEPAAAFETAAFPLVHEGGSWKIKAFDLPPHVSVSALRKHVQEVMEDDEKQSDFHRTAMLKALNEKLDALSR